MFEVAVDHEAFHALDAGAYALDQLAQTMAAQGLLMSSLEMSNHAGVLRRLRRDSLGIPDAEERSP